MGTLSLGAAARAASGPGRARAHRATARSDRAFDAGAVAPRSEARDQAFAQGVGRDISPALCPIRRRPITPLKVGIDDDLGAVAPELIGGRKKLLSELLKQYTSSPVYLVAPQPGAERVALDGEAAGNVTTAEAERAAERLDALRSRPVPINAAGAT
jgi:hypothetical protein